MSRTLLGVATLAACVFLALSSTHATPGRTGDAARATTPTQPEAMGRTKRLPAAVSALIAWGRGDPHDSTKTAVVTGDDRSLVADETSRPHRAIGKVLAEFWDGTRVSATGVLVSKKLVLTAASVVFNAEHGGFATEVVFLRGYRDGEARFGTHVADKVFVLPEYTNFGGAQPHLDIGAVHLTRRAGRKKDIVAIYAPRWEKGLSGDGFTTAGYPTELDGAQRLYGASGSAAPIGWFLGLGESLDTSEGQQGSPVWRTTRVRGRDKHQLVAVVSGYSSVLDATVARRVLPDVKHHVKFWKRGRPQKTPGGDPADVGFWNFTKTYMSVTLVDAYGSETPVTGVPAGRVVGERVPRGVLQRFAFYLLDAQGERGDQPDRTANLYITGKYGPHLKFRPGK